MGLEAVEDKKIDIVITDPHRKSELLYNEEALVATMEVGSITDVIVDKSYNLYMDDRLVEKEENE